MEKLKALLSIKYIHYFLIQLCVHLVSLSPNDIIIIFYKISRIIIILEKSYSELDNYIMISERESVLFFSRYLHVASLSSAMYFN